LRILYTALLLVALLAPPRLEAQDSPALALAKAIDQEILQLKDLPGDAQPRAVKDLALRIRRQPKAYGVALAWNLAVNAEACGRDALQEVATTLAGALRASPQDHNEDAYGTLAEFARYDQLQVSIDDPRYTVAIAKLEANDLHRSQSDFTLADLQGKKWNLKNLRGKVVPVNFWATWCPPCRKEIPDMNALHQRFQGQSLVILSISDEEAAAVKSFVAEQKISYPVLIDPGHRVKDVFLVRGIPYSFVFDREGRLVTEAVNRPTMQGFLEMLGQAGLK
jgi:peroxiredoxin